MKKKFSAWTTDEENLLNSSSGGIFFELAKKMIIDGGSVVGVIWDGLKAKYILSNDLEEIKKMRGSKYIPSNPANVIRKIKDSNEKILFTGLPCHIEAVKKVCNTENMILCDLICHGLPKSGIFEEQIKKIKKGREIKSIKFRDKKAGWELGQSLIVEFSNGETYDCHDDYMKDYMSNIILRDNCVSCKKKNLGDITIGDFWGVHPSLKNFMGTSLVIINTKKVCNMDIDSDVVYHFTEIPYLGLLVNNKTNKTYMIPDAVYTGSEIKKALDAVNAVIAKTATSDQRSYTIEGRSLERRNNDELIGLRNDLEQKYAQELREERLEQGVGGSKIYVRFRG